MIAEKVRELERIRREEGATTALRKAVKFSHKKLYLNFLAGAVLKTAGGVELQHQQSSQNVNSYRYGESETIDIDPPRGTGPVLDFLEKEARTYQVPPQDIFEVKNAKIAGPTPKRMTADGRFIFDQPFRKETIQRDIRRDIRNKNAVTVFRDYIFQEPTLNLDKAVICNQRTGFYHFFVNS